MRLGIGFLAAAVVTGAATAAAAGPSVEIRDAVARVVVIPEDRNDVKVETLTTNRALSLDIRQTPAGVVIDGHLRHRIRDCHAGAENPWASVRGVGRVDYRDMPQIVIHAPRAVSVESDGAVFGAIGRSASVDLDNSGCSAWTVADVAGDATVHDSGIGQIRMGRSARLDVRLSGVTNIHATHTGGLDANLSGTGGLTLDELSGPLQAHVSGAGRIKVLQGNAGPVRASISGVGGIDFGGTAQSLDAEISGIGSVRVKAVTGQITKSVSGLGHVTIG